MLLTELDPSTVDAVVLDVGGVLLLPVPEVVTAALREAEVAHHTHDDAFREAHYHGMAAYDRSDDPPEVWHDYLHHYLGRLGVATDDLPQAKRHVGRTFDRRTDEVWVWVIDSSLAALRRLEDLGIPLAIVSNADGHIAASLQRHRVAQVGPGEGVAMTAIVDSGVVDITKPDPRIFAFATEALGVPAERCLYVGDSVRNDVVGAAAAGLRPIHLDPFELHDDAAHHRIRALGDLAALLGG